MAKKDKYGSPYDPANGRNNGKVHKPPEERYEDPVVCTDPNCRTCGALSNWPDNPSSPSARFYNNREIIEKVFGVRPTTSGVMIEEGRSSRTPPPSYTAAREKVEKYVHPAPTQTFDDIVGNEEALALLKDAIQAPVTHKELYAAYGMKMPKGAMLSGPPGCGKTMFAKAAVSEMRRLYGAATEYLSIEGSELQSPYVGMTEAEIKNIFTYAREYKAFRGHPLLVFIDEADSILPDRTGRARKVYPWEESQVAVFLAEMDGIKECGAFVLLATNRPEVIDQAVLRDGRCDFKIVIKRPTIEAIEGILRKGFVSCPILKEPVDTLVFAAIESLRDPHKVIKDARAIKLMIEEDGLKADTRTRHFLLEHILSGAMAASIPLKATRYAFNRDKAAGLPTGVCSDDVIRAVDDLFLENRTLDHSYALGEFMAQFLDELNSSEQPKNKGMH